jgi:ferredoxin--NADP+ reductase
MPASSVVPGHPVRVAVVGSGPAGFYAAGLLLGHRERVIEVDMFDRLPTPWGLVRAGVAPDHPKIKSVTRVFEKTAAMAGFRFHGNVDVGNDVSHEALVNHYHVVLYAVGSPVDRRLGIPGEHLAGSYAATEFVSWYNGHPDFSDHEFNLGSRRAVVIGNGNVALDVARMLALTPDELAGTDTADHALRALADSQVEEIVVLGRRGPAQAAYTNAELRELGELADADVVVNPAEVVLDEHSRAIVQGEHADHRVVGNVDIVTEYAKRQPQGKRKRVVLKFLRSPVEIVGTDQVEALRVIRNELVPADGDTIQAFPTGATETIETGLVLRSVGYAGKPVPGIPFDELRQTIRNDRGRVTEPATGEPVLGVYVTGWIKRGPSGVIGTNKKCAQETVDLLLQDVAAGRVLNPTRDPEALLEGLGRDGVQVVDYRGWESIDEHERALGQAQGRPRIKLVRRRELLARAAAVAHANSEIAGR